MKTVLTFSALCLLLSSGMMAQVLGDNEVLVVRERRGVTVSGGLQLAVPKGEFADNYGGYPFGVNASLSIPMLNLPFEIGGGFVWNGMGRSNRSVDILNTLSPEMNQGKLTVNGNAYTYQVHGRLRPFNGKFRPYGELFAGVRNFSIRSSLDLDNVNQASGDLLERDFTFLAGYAIGAKYQLTPGIFLEARFDTQAGSRATYVDPESVKIEQDGSFSYQTKSSRTDQWALSLGLAFSL